MGRKEKSQKWGEQLHCEVCVEEMKSRSQICHEDVIEMRIRWRVICWLDYISLSYFYLQDLLPCMAQGRCSVHACWWRRRHMRLKSILVPSEDVSQRSLHHSLVTRTSCSDGRIPHIHIWVSSVRVEFEQPYPKSMFAGTISTRKGCSYDTQEAIHSNNLSLLPLHHVRQNTLCQGQCP